MADNTEPPDLTTAMLRVVVGAVMGFSHVAAIAADTVGWFGVPWEEWSTGVAIAAAIATVFAAAFTAWAANSARRSAKSSQEQIELQQSLLEPIFEASLKYIQDPTKLGPGEVQQAQLILVQRGGGVAREISIFCDSLTQLARNNAQHKGGPRIPKIDTAATPIVVPLWALPGRGGAPSFSTWKIKLALEYRTPDGKLRSYWLLGKSETQGSPGPGYTVELRRYEPEFDEPRPASAIDWRWLD